MNSNNQIIWKNGKQWLRQLVILHSAMTIGVVIISFMLYFIIGFHPEGEPTSSIPASGTIGTVIAFLGLIISNFLYRHRLGRIPSLGDLNAKLLHFRTAVIPSYALIQGPILINLLIGFLDSNLLNLTVALIMVVFLYLKRPVKDKILKDMRLSKEEIEEFERG